MYKTYHLAVAFILFTTSHIVSAQAEYQGTPVSTTVFVLFANGSTAFRPTTASVETLLNARDAAMVTIRGRTSTNTPTAQDEALALARATAARAYLIRQGCWRRGKIEPGGQVSLTQLNSRKPKLRTISRGRVWIRNCRRCGSISRRRQQRV